MNVIITGASSGIGRALAARFALAGHRVMAVARREALLVALAEEMAGQGAEVIPYALDITLSGAAQTLLGEAERTLGTVHVLVNNAGMSPYQRFTELSAAHVRQVIALNVEALTALCHAFVPHMLAHGEASHVVNVGSVGGYTPLPNFSVYTGTKQYVRAFTDLLRYELRGTNVVVSGLHPGGTVTEFQAGAGQKVTPFARRTMMTPAQVAARAYPAIMRGRRVIVIGFIDKLAVLVGRVLPFPWAIRVMELVYWMNVEKVDPGYGE